MKPKIDDHSDSEATKRFEAALRGARLVGHQPMKEQPSKRPGTKTKKRRIAKSFGASSAT